MIARDHRRNDEGRNVPLWCKAAVPVMAAAFNCIKHFAQGATGTPLTHGPSFPMIEISRPSARAGADSWSTIALCAFVGCLRPTKHAYTWQSAQNHPLAARPFTASLLKSPRSLPPRKAYRRGPSAEPGLAWPSASGLDHKHARTPRRECEASSHHDRRPASFV